VQYAATKGVYPPKRKMCIRNGCDGGLMAKIIIAAIQGNLTASPNEEDR